MGASLTENTPAANNPWVRRPVPRPAARLRLFCFPYAGGGAQAFRSWPARLPAEVEVCPVQLPGRENRLAEAPYERLDELVEAACRALLEHLDRPFAFFGHSLGALLSFEAARHLRARHGLAPEHLFVAGRAAPQWEREDRALYDLPEAELIQELRRLGGTPPEVLAHADLMQLMLPLLRADFALSDTYVYAAAPRLACPVSAFGGARDEQVPRESLEAWREQTEAEFTLQMFPGDHFFIHSDEALLLGALSPIIGRVLSRLGRDGAGGASS